MQLCFLQHRQLFSKHHWTPRNADLLLVHSVLYDGNDFAFMGSRQGPLLVVNHSVGVLISEVFVVEALLFTTCCEMMPEAFHHMAMSHARGTLRMLTFGSDHQKLKSLSQTWEGSQQEPDRNNSQGRDKKSCSGRDEKLLGPGKATLKTMESCPAC